MSAAATHRTAVRDRVTAVLKAGVGQVEGRVYRARTWPLQEHEHPALLVYGWEEEMKRQGGDAVKSFFKTDFILAVEVRVLDRARSGEEVEAELEAISGAVRDLVLTDAGLLLNPGRLIEHFEGVKTTLGINTQGSELALGRALVAFAIRWTESFTVPEPDQDCGCDDTSLALTPVPVPSTQAL